MNNLASLLSDHSSSKKDLEKALNLALNAQKVRAEDPSILDTLGWIYYRQNDFNKAFDFIRRAQEKAPNAAVIDYHMGMVLYSLGKKAEARAHLKKASEAKENFFGKEEAKKTLEKL
jgi:Flp pilus assembly protein TadD